MTGILIRYFWSLMMTGDSGKERVNPIAVLIAVGLLLFAYDSFTDWRAKGKLVDQSEIVQEQAERKITKLIEVTKNETKAKEAIPVQMVDQMDEDVDLSDWSKRVNGMQRKTD